MTADCFVIAEIGSNHNGKLDEAYRLIDLAAEAGASAAKFQSFSADSLYSSRAPRFSDMRGRAGDDGTITPHQLAGRLEMSRDWHPKLAERCAEAGIEFMSTPFDLEAVEQLAPYVARFKLASFDLTYVQLIREVARQGRPILLSTGHAYLGEVEAALGWIRAEDAELPVTVLHCVSTYPALPEDANLAVMQLMQSAFGLPVGFSDHTLGIAVALAAVALGATVIEKHFTSDREQEGPDHSFALEPAELKMLVEGAAEARSALGDGVKAPRLSEEENRTLARRSIHLAADLPVGHRLGADDVRIVRPGVGIAPAELDVVLGRPLRRVGAEGEPLTWDMV
jgi:N-acetylneuraminate synthase/N,N'-diacetyllegionaminate synthase